MDGHSSDILISDNKTHINSNLVHTNKFCTTLNGPTVDPSVTNGETETYESKLKCECIGSNSSCITTSSSFSTSLTSSCKMSIMNKSNSISGSSRVHKASASKNTSCLSSNQCSMSVNVLQSRPSTPSLSSSFNSSNTSVRGLSGKSSVQGEFLNFILSPILTLMLSYMSFHLSFLKIGKMHPFLKKKKLHIPSYTQKSLVKIFSLPQYEAQ